MGIIQKKEQLIKYLNKNYYIKENKFFLKYNNEHEWGFSILESLPIIFNFDEPFCKEILTIWAYENDLNKEKLKLAWGVRTLRAIWSPEMAQDLTAMYGITSAEEELTKLLSREIAKEIDEKIISDLASEFKTKDNFLSVLKCVGYELTDATYYDENTFTPKKKFVSMKYNEMIKERENNEMYKKWIREQSQF